jgi:hypothetical protein
MNDTPLSLWLSWLTDLGGTFNVFHDLLPEPKPPTGRRDPDRKPRQYPLGTHKPEINQYGITSNGCIVRLEVGV